MRAVDLVERFAELFRGNKSAYGVHIPELAADGKKAKGRSFMKNEPLGLEHYKQHLAGEQSIGVVPIDENSNVRFMAIDVDVYPLDPLQYCKVIEKYNLPLVPFKSKSGGLHLYCFFSEDVSAAKALDYLHVLRHVLLIPASAETFPKQRRLTGKGKGNFINLPYFDAEKTGRYAYDVEGRALSFESALDYCYERRTTLRDFVGRVEALPLSSAPPCLQAMLMNCAVSITARNRNIFLFNAAVYLKARWKEEFVDRLYRLNDALDVPLEAGELESTIAASHQRGNYTYQCGDASLSSYCSKAICSAREYGKNTGTVSDFTFEHLVQVRATPPYYKWLVNGVEMVFYSESELRSQERFMDLCMRYLHRVPCKLKAAEWANILNKALQEIVLEDVRENEEELSTTSLWLAYLHEFFTERTLAASPAQVETGLVYRNENGYWFRVDALVQWLEVVKRFRGFTLPQMHYELKKRGCRSGRLYDNATRRYTRAWVCPPTAFSSATQEATGEAGVGADSGTAGARADPREQGGSGAKRLQQLVDEMTEDTLEFSHLKEEDKC